MLAVVAFASSMASAQLLKNFKYTGNLDVNATSGDHSIVATKASFSNINSRLMLGMNFDLNDDVNAQVTAIKSDYRYYGTDSQNVDALTANIKFAEAYINLKNVLGINHKVGKQFYGKPGDIVIYYGPSYQNLDTAIANFTVSSLDGWYGEWAKNKWTVTGLAAKVTENSLVAATDKNLYGVTGSYALSDIVKPAVYFYESNDGANVTLHNTLDVVGVKADGKYQGVGYGVEYAMNFGKNKVTTKSYKGSALKANANYSLDAKTAGKFDFTGEFAMGTGNKATTSATKNEEFTAISSNYLPGMIFGPYYKCGLGNLTTFNVGAKFMPKQIEKLSIAGTFYNFGYTQKVGLVSTIGTELDFAATWKHSENVSLKAYYASFSADSKYSTKTNAETLMGLNLGVKF